MSDIKEIIVRRKEFPDKKCWVTTNSSETRIDPSYGLCKWSNCLYLHFNKKDFANLKYPEKEESYYDSDFTKLNFHGGVTFYEEQVVGDQIYIKVGCDYQHLYDDQDYGQCDSGIRIINESAESLANQLVELNNKRGMNETHN